MLTEKGIPPNRIWLAGDSAGGGLALATLVALREHGLPQPACAVGLSPMLDLRWASEGRSEEANEIVVLSSAGQNVPLAPSGEGQHRLRPYSQAIGEFDCIQGKLALGCARQYLQGQDPRNPKASPLLAPLRGLAPILLQTGELEIFVEECREMKARAEKQGLGDDQLRLEVYAAMTHVFMLNKYIPEARAAARALSAFVERKAAKRSALGGA
jgi:acetyl esterase/lipase